MRLFDKLAGNGSKEIREYLRNLRNDFAVIEADDVAKYWATAMNMECNKSEVPFSIPPWHQCFVEFFLPNDVSIKRLGNIFNLKNDRTNSVQMGGIFTTHVAGDNPVIFFNDSEFLDTKYHEGESILVRMQPAAFTQKMGPMLFNKHATWVLNKEGEILAERLQVEKEESAFLIRMVLEVGALAFTFANCKNVTLEDTTAEQEPSPKIKRRLKIPSVNRYTLNISGKSTLRGNTSDEPGQEGIMPWHLCRGHFATYTEEKPLFGKYTGKFWIPPHMKGKKERGEIIKDYSIKTKESVQ